LSDRLLRWFEKRVEAETVRRLREQMELVLKTSRSCMEALKEAVEGKAREAANKCLEAQMLEREADTLRRGIIDKVAAGLRRGIIDKVAAGELPAEDRDDFMRLARLIDLVADWSLESCRTLQVIGPRFAMILSASPPEKKMLNEFRDNILSCVEKLKQSLDELFRRNVDRALELADEVERAEEKVDELYQKARTTFLASKRGEVSAGEVVVLGELLDALENVADRCEDSCDQIRVIAVRAVA